MPTPRFVLLAVGVILDVFGFLLLFTAYLSVPVPQWEVGAALLAIGIVLDIAGVLA
jgi:uncharacterized membrane protein HdeD (DUF308 family)